MTRAESPIARCTRIHKKDTSQTCTHRKCGARFYLAISSRS